MADEGRTESGEPVLRWHDHAQRAEGLEQDKMNKLPGEWGHVNDPTVSWTAKSPGKFEGGADETHRWDKGEATKLAHRASQLPPEYKASVHQYDHDKMQEKLHKEFVNGHLAFAEKGLNSAQDFGNGHAKPLALPSGIARVMAENGMRRSKGRGMSL